MEEYGWILSILFGFSSTLNMDLQKKKKKKILPSQHSLGHVELVR